MSDQPWWTTGVVYELHVKTFCDSNGDGIGDFQGLISKLDYLQSLGISAIWLLPFYPSPLRDDGYDIADYFTINPDYGTMEDFQTFLGEAHSRGLKVITELVVNHTSDQHRWFQAARHAPEGSLAREFYVWSSTDEKYADTRIIFLDTEPSNWAWDDVAGAYYWHRFFSHQPDLNYDNPAVHDAVVEVLDFWLGMGVDGLRLDAVPYLYEREGTNCENLPETHAFLKKLRAHVDEHFPGRLILAEANQWPEDTMPYFGDGDECHMNYHFPLMPRLYLALARQDKTPIVEILDRTPDLPAGARWATFLRNHDELTLEMVTPEERRFMWDHYASDPRAPLNLGIRRRLTPLMGGDERRVRLLCSLLFSLPGTPFLYYGDEIGMGDDLDLPDRDGVRTPMQWDDSQNGGFSSAHPDDLILPAIASGEFGYPHRNVAAAEAHHSSLLHWVRWAIATRAANPALSDGSIEWVDSPQPVLAFRTTHPDQTVLVAANLSDERQVMAGSGIDLASGEQVDSIDLDPYGFRWLVQS